MRVCRMVAMGALVFFGGSAAVMAATCSVPTGTHPTIQTAVDDIGCTEIELGSYTYVESVTIGREVSILGVSPAATTIAGRVAVNATAAVVTLGELTVDGSHPAVAGCYVEAVDVADGGRLIPNNVVVVNGDGSACVLFEDGFEDGTTDAWDSVAP